MRQSPTLGVFYVQYGPLHHARVKALQAAWGTDNVTPFELVDKSSTYSWSTVLDECEGLITLSPGVSSKEVTFFDAFAKARKLIKKHSLSHVLVQGYWPPTSVAVHLAAKSLGAHSILTTCSHDGTEKAGFWGRAVKRGIVKSFDAAIVAGSRHVRYLGKMGFPTDRCVVGANCIDNIYFSAAADRVRATPGEREKLGLPARYILNAGRFIEKKNLSILIRAFSQAAIPEDVGLVLVGSGEQKCNLINLAIEQGMSICENGIISNKYANNSRRTVFFFDFQQIEELPKFYAFATAFALPSIEEEWGNVVNEAMASELPVIASSELGCVPDLLPIHIEELKSGARLRSNGLIVSPFELPQMVEAIEYVFENDLQAMSRASRTIIDNYSCERFAANLKHLAESLIHG